MSKDNFYANLSPVEAITLIKRKLAADLLDEEIIQLDNGKMVGVLVFEKYYFRSENRAGLTVIVSDVDGRTNIKSIASGSSKGMIFSFDWGAGDNFAASIYKILKEYII